MKKILLLLLVSLISLNVIAQLPYSWTPNVNPGWSSTNSGSGNALNWSVCNAVTTNCSGNYQNNQNTTYTSFIIDASCTNAPTLDISFFISGNAENSWDFLFMEYSLDGGTTWINPYGVNVGLTGNAGAGITWTLPPIPTSNTFRFRFQFVSDPSVRAVGYRITNFQIPCDVFLPIDLIDFGAKYNSSEKNVKVEWSANVTHTDEHFVIQRSKDGTEFDSIGIIYPNEVSTNYFEFIDNSPYYNGISYYRLKMIERDNYHFSNISAIEVDGYTNEISLYPNPFNDNIKVQNLGEYKGICSISIYDALGKLVLQKTIDFNLESKYEIDTKILTSGVYTVEMKTDQITKSSKLRK